MLDVGTAPVTVQSRNPMVQNLGSRVWGLGSRDCGIAAIEFKQYVSSLFLGFISKLDVDIASVTVQN